jgi:hypothetical protein
MHAVDSPVSDADNHYDEVIDAFTRHLHPVDGPPVIKWGGNVATLNQCHAVR